MTYFWSVKNIWLLQTEGTLRNLPKIRIISGFSDDPKTTYGVYQG